MKLKTLGGLSLEDSDFTRLKPLMLLAYLSLEGEQSRAFMAQLLWGSAKQPFNSLAQAIDQLKRLAPGTVAVTNTHVKALVTSDASELMHAVESRRDAEVIALYRGQFLEDSYPRGLSFEVEDWLLGTRELLASYAQTAFINEAQRCLNQPHKAKAYAEQAYKLNAHTDSSETTLQHLYTLLRTTGSPHARPLQKEAAELGLTLTEEALPKKPQTPSHLPSYSNRFFGRKGEQQDVTHMISQPECQLLTLSGPGGIGKTRLASELSHQLQTRGDFERLCFINLEPYSSAQDIANALAQALNLSLDPQMPPLPQIVQQLADQASLIILDNFEHLLSDESKALVSTLLNSCPTLNLIITTRERLELAQEWLLPLHSLNRPEEALPSVEHAQAYDAINLFVDRAKHANIHFKLSEDNLGTVQTLIDQTAGLPLAIELAASWLQALPPEAITRELESNLDILSSASHPPKHQSLRTTFEHSWQRLSQTEQTILQALSVFEGGFSKRAATHLTDVSYPQLAKLIGKSLLQTTKTGRYTLHPLLKHYLDEKLAGSGTLHETQSKHAAYFLSYLTETAEKLGTADEGHALDAIAQEIANLKKAWLHACKYDKPDAELPRQLRRFFDTRARYQEGVDLFEGSLNVIETKDNDVLIAAIKAALAWLLLRLRRLEEARRLSLEAQDALKGHDEPSILLNILTTLGTIERLEQNYEQSADYFRETLNLARQYKFSDRLPTYMTNLASLEMILGHYSNARKLFEEALVVEETKQDLSALALTLNNLGNLLISMGEFDAAETYLRQGLQYAEKAQLKTDIPRLKTNLARALHGKGQNSEAKTLAIEALSAYIKHNSALQHISLRALGRIEAALGNIHVAIDHLKEAVLLCQQAKSTQDLLETLTFLAQIKLQQNEYEQAFKWLHFVIHHPKSGRWLTNYANSLIDEETIAFSYQDNNLTLQEVVQSVFENDPAFTQGH